MNKGKYIILTQTLDKGKVSLMVQHPCKVLVFGSWSCPEQSDISHEPIL